MMESKTILIVDDEPRTREGIKKLLEGRGDGHCRIFTAGNSLEALRVLESEPVHLLITDIRMPEMSGLQLVDALDGEGIRNKPEVILVSGYAEFEYAQQAIQLRVVQYLLKPIGKPKLFEAVDRALAAADERLRLDMMRKVVDPELLKTGGRLSSVGDAVREAAAYVDNNLHLPLTLKDAANAVHLNPSYLSALFKEQMRMTFSEYLTRRRLQKAKELLLQTSLPVSEIAERVGYQSAKYFNRMFREYEKTSPGQYRHET